MKTLPLFMVLVLPILLCSCAATQRVNLITGVQNFPTREGVTFTVGNGDGLNWNSMAELRIIGKLKERGWEYLNKGVVDYRVLYRAELVDKRQENTYSAPVYSSTMYSPRTAMERMDVQKWSSGARNSFSGPLPIRRELVPGSISSREYYKTRIVMAIIPESDFRVGRRSFVYFFDAYFEAEEPNREAVALGLLDHVFKNFPGKNNRRSTIKIPLPKAKG